MDSIPIGKTGPMAQGERAVCSSSLSLVTDMILQVMRVGGNADDRAVVGCMFQAVVEPHMTNHAGSIQFLYWVAVTSKAYQHNDSGIPIPGLLPFRPIPLIVFVLPVLVAPHTLAFLALCQRLARYIVVSAQFHGRNYVSQ